MPGKTIRAGDTLIGLRSAGLHTNGYSLARKNAFEVAGLGVHDRVPELDGTIGEVLLTEHRSYLRSLERALDAGLVKGLAHITGGGITDNLPRILPEGTCAEVRRGSSPVLPVFSWIERHGRVAADEMARTFNMGIGMVCVTGAGEVDALERSLAEAGEASHRIGRIVAGSPSVAYV